jgi:ABC-2 type transport system permease protein
VQFGGTPNVVHSDMFGDAPYRASWNWYTIYWLLFCGLLGIMTVMFWPRGKQDGWRARSRNAGLRYQSGWISASVILLILFGATGGWIWYNTAAINRTIGPKHCSVAKPSTKRLTSNMKSWRNLACAA